MATSSRRRRHGSPSRRTSATLDTFNSTSLTREDVLILRELEPSRDADSISITSTATAPNLPGPGRSIGKFYDSAGRKLENALWKAGVRIRQSKAQEKVSSGLSTTSTETAPNLPGPGRALGQVYDFYGSKLVEVLTSVALKLKRGPDAAFSRVASGIFEMQVSSDEQALVDYLSDENSLPRRKVPFTFGETKEEKRLKKIMDGVDELLKYAASEVPSNRHMALNHIASLAIADPLLRRVLTKRGAIRIIHEFRPRTYVCCDDYGAYDSDVRDTFGLLSCSRKALISLSEVEVNRIAGEKPQLGSLDWSVHGMNVLLRLSRFAGHPEVSFLAFRHMLRHFNPNDDSVVVEKLIVTSFIPGNVLAADPRIFEWSVLDDMLARVLQSFLVSEVALQQRLFRDGSVRIVCFVLINSRLFPHCTDIILKCANGILRRQIEMEALVLHGFGSYAQDHGVFYSEEWRTRAPLCANLFLTALLARPEYKRSFALSANRSSVNETANVDVEESLQYQLWMALFAQPDVLLSAIRQGVDESITGYREYSVPEPRKLAALCDKVARILSGKESGVSLRDSLVDCVHYFLDSDRYSRNEMKRALKRHGVSVPAPRTTVARITVEMESKLYSENFYSPTYFDNSVVKLYRHTTKGMQGGLGWHIFTVNSFFKNSTASCPQCAHEAYQPLPEDSFDLLHVDSEDVLFFHISPSSDVHKQAKLRNAVKHRRNGSKRLETDAFDVRYHEGIVAFHAADSGEAQYLAIPIKWLRPPQLVWSTVANHASTLTYVERVHAWGREEPLISKNCTDEFAVVVMKSDVEKGGDCDERRYCWENVTSPIRPLQQDAA